MPRIGFGLFENYDARRSTLHAFKAGYRLVDSAQIYGNEKQLGAAIHSSGLDRGELFIVTKCVSNTESYDATLKGIDESLENLQTSYIDLFLIHDPVAGKRRRLEIYKALLDCKATGKIRSVGVSNFNVKHIEEIKEAGYELPSINQIELHPFCQQKAIVEYCRANNIVIQAYCPILRGNLVHPAIIGVANKHVRDPAKILLRWSLQHGFVPLPKSVTPSRIQSNIDLYDFVLDADDMHALDVLDRGSKGAISWNPIDAE
ncbi:putative oxidoreductase [Psilocybe cubensis]|uniref:Oxidoreductase n=2 Tax=Psilocybe cubensis TaxID=181762 RepID=A0ACB8HB76_PSICU|nr:putative oxidoreductase [Psilocybe cubensis]KAH9485101.1 putative oxidoreductase [Psilocybe cubensis]